jgi:hypothetical protein
MPGIVPTLPWQTERVKPLKFSTTSPSFANHLSEIYQIYVDLSDIS